jgi:ATP-binding cassette, subfamily B, bacterial
MNGVLAELKAYFLEKMAQSVSRYVYALLHQKLATLDLSNFENPDKQDKAHRAVQEAGFRPIKILNALLTAIQSVVSVACLLGMFTSIRWYLVLILVVAVIPDLLVRVRFSRLRYNLKDSQNTREREMHYYNRVLTGFPFAKEQKLFGFSGYFLKRFRNTQDSLFSEKLSLSKSEVRLAVFAQLFAVVLIFSSLGLVTLLKASGSISIGTVVLFFFAFQRGFSVLNDFFRSFTQLGQDNAFLKDLVDFLQFPYAFPTREMEPHFSLSKAIHFEHVSFRYESSKRDALKNVDFTIPAGKTVAFVGENGSGKTTLIKLLCGFYMPDSGKILFDGIDTAQLGQTIIREHIAAVFQDFALYNIPVADNIGLGRVDASFDIEKVKDSAKAAGIDDVIQKLPGGYSTLLGNLFKGGEELSIGQWQKIAIARAFFRDAPLLLMDEPSSALDAESEKQVIESLKKLASNKTAVIISHRLTTVQWVDVIYLFHEGELLEHGSHQELMNLKGKYYKMYQSFA